MGRDRADSATHRTDLLWAGGLFLIAWLPRLLHLLTVRNSPFFSILILDPLMYDEWGQALARGESPGGVYFQDPLYAYLLALIYSVFGHHYVPVAALQGLLGAIVAPLTFLSARPWFDRSTSSVAGLVAALYLPAIYYEGLVLKTSLGLFWVALLLALVSRALRSSSMIRWALAGVVLGLGALTRGNLVLLFPVLALWILLDREPEPSRATPLRSRLTDRRRWSVVGALALGCAIVLVPTALRNRIVGGEWVLTTANAGQNFYIGNNPLNTTGEYQRLPFVDPNPKYEQRDFAREASRRTGRSLSPAATSRFWFRQSLDWMRDSPGDWLALMWLKLRAFWTAYEIPDNLDYYLYRQTAPVLRWPIPGFGLVAPLALLGAALAWNKPGWPRLLVLVMLAYAFTVILFFVFSRFRMAIMPAMYVLAAQAAVELWRTLRHAITRRRLPPRLAAMTVAFLLLLAFVNLPVRARAESWSARLATTLGLPARIETSANAHFNIAVAYAAQAKQAPDPDRWLSLAEQELRKAWQQEQRYASIPIELGKVLARQGRNREAIDAYTRALELEPANYRIHHALGLLQTRTGDLPAAEASFRTALELEPRHTPSATQLGEVLLRQAKPDEATQAFQYALRLNPNDKRAAEGLKQALAETAESRD